MLKKELSWLIIRAIGLYFAYCALVSFFALASSVPELFSLPKLEKQGQEAEFEKDPSTRIETNEKIKSTAAEKELERLESERLAAALKEFFKHLGVTALYLFGAFYCIRDGRHLFDILSKEEPLELERRPAEVTGLNLDVDPEAAMVMDHVSESPSSQAASAETSASSVAQPAAPVEEPTAPAPRRRDRRENELREEVKEEAKDEVKEEMKEEVKDEAQTD